MKSTLLELIMMFILPIAASFGQADNNDIIVFGLVTDIQKKPISGAHIRVDGEETTTTTDDKGYFKLSVSPDADSVSVIASTYAIGTSEISQKPVVFRLYPLTDSASLSQQSRLARIKSVNEEYYSLIDSVYSLQPDRLSGIKSVNVTNGQFDNTAPIKNEVYGLVDETASIPVIDGRNQKYSSYKSIFDMLSGIAGVYVVRGDGLTGETNIYIRGATSLFSKMQPICIVDGIERDIKDIDYINPSMVKAIQVLKGPTASIYGTRGACGVIIITLK